MKKSIILSIVFTFFLSAISGQTTYWKSTDSEGMAYNSFIENDDTWDDHFRFYYTGNDNHYLMRLRYDYQLDVYRMRMDHGWSGEYYLFFEDGYLNMRVPESEWNIKFKKISSSQIPDYILYDTYYREKVVH